MHVLFVDDDELLLRAIRRGLVRKRGEIEALYAADASAASQLLAAHEVDIVVTDLSMPGRDGCELLHEVRELYPATVRLVLSGTFDRDRTVATLPVAHQLVPKPCSLRQLTEIIERIAARRRAVVDPGLRALAAASCGPACSPRSLDELRMVLAKPAPSMPAVSRLIHRSPAIAAQVMRIAASAFLGASHRIESVGDAIAVLGHEALARVIEVPGLFVVAEDAEADHREHGHSVAVARLAGALGNSDEAYTAGLLHDIGRHLLLARSAESPLAEDGGAGLDDERRRYGTTHAELGGYLLTLWGLPQRLVEAVAMHHTPVDSEELATMVRAAETVVDSVSAGRAIEQSAALDVPGLDTAAVSRLIARFGQDDA